MHWTWTGQMNWFTIMCMHTANLHKGFRWLIQDFLFICHIPVNVPFLISQPSHGMQKTPVNPTYWLPNPSALQCHHDYRGKFHPWLSAHPSTLDSSQALINISHVDKLYYYPPSFLIWEPDTLVTLGQSQSDHSWDFRSVYFTCFYLR